MTIRASVIIPAYNAETTIYDCIQTLVAQEGVSFDYEIIVVDDCSTDNTVERLNQIRAEFENSGVIVQLFSQEKNGGPAAARNRGAMESSGEILLFSDSDCHFENDWLIEMVTPFEANQVAAVKGAYKTKQNELVARFAQAEFEERYSMLSQLEYIDVVFSYSAAIRRSVFMEIGGFDTSFPVADNEDTDLSWKISESGCLIKFNPRAIVYHLHPSTVRSYCQKKFSRAYWRACVYRRFPKKAVKDSYTPQGLKLQIVLAFLIIITLPLTVIRPEASYLSAALMILFVICIVPFVRGLGNVSIDLKFASPLLLFLRASAMAAGLIWVLPRITREDPFSDTTQRGTT